MTKLKQTLALSAVMVAGMMFLCIWYAVQVDALERRVDGLKKELEAERSISAQAVDLAKMSDVVSELRKQLHGEQDDLDLLARVIHEEARGESYEGKLMVGSVVVNRVKHASFPNTVREVVYQKNQFDVLPKLSTSMSSDDSRKAAKEVMTKGSILPREVVVFFNKGVNESWVQSRKVYKVVGNHAFAYLDRK